MKKVTEAQVDQFLASDEFKDSKIVAAFIIDKTPTETDNQVVAGVGNYAGKVAGELSSIEELDPTAGEAIQAAIRLAQKVASLTDNKWDDIVVGLAAKITGANKKK